MPWFEAHDTMGRHPKTLKLAEILKIKRREAVGLLHDLFAWGLYAARKDGELPGMTEFQIGVALDCETKKAAQKVVSGLLEAGYLEQDEQGTYYIHDWYDYAGRYCEERDRNRRKVKAYRDKKKAERYNPPQGNCNGNVTVTEPVQTPGCNPDVTGQPIPYLTIPSSYAKQEGEYTVLPRTGDGASNASNPFPRKSEALAYYCQRINPTPSAECLALLEHFETEMGTDVCKLAMDRALDNQSPRWSYIRGILRSWSADGVKCLSDVQALDERYRKRRKAPVAKKSQGPVPAAGMEQCSSSEEHEQRVVENEAWMRRFLEETREAEKAEQEAERRKGEENGHKS